MITFASDPQDQRISHPVRPGLICAHICDTVCIELALTGIHHIISGHCG